MSATCWHLWDGMEPHCYCYYGQREQFRIEVDLRTGFVRYPIQAMPRKSLAAEAALIAGAVLDGRDVRQLLSEKGIRHVQY